MESARSERFAAGEEESQSGGAHQQQQSPQQSSEITLQGQVPVAQELLPQPLALGSKSKPDTAPITKHRPSLLEWQPITITYGTFGGREEVRHQGEDYRYQLLCGAY